MIDFSKVIRSTWSNYITEISFAFGSAARGNRGRYAGSHVHVLRVEKVVGIEPGTESQCQPGTIGYNFLKRGVPQTFATQPMCGCTQGQHAGSASSSLTADDVTCTKCLKIMGVN